MRAFILTLQRFRGAPQRAPCLRMFGGMAFASLLAAGQVAAQSIETISGPMTGNNGSIVTLSCNHCPPKATAPEKLRYVVPQATAGSDHVEVRQIDGKMKLVSTEAYRGGSPVVFITTAGEMDIKAARADIPYPVATPQTASIPAGDSTAGAGNTIDTTQKTSGIAQSALGASPAASQGIDAQSFQLRLN